jgi:integrase/recombinase XerD
MNTRALEGEACRGSLYDHVELFLHQLRAAGYAEHTLRRKRFALRSLARWAEGKGIPISDFHDRHIAIFQECSSGRVKDFVAVQRRAIQQFLRFLRSATGEASPSASTSTTGWHDLLREYEDHLRNNYGLAENSLRVYVPLIRSFLAAQAGRSGRVSRRSFNPLAIRDFVLIHIQNRSAEYVRLLGTALRSFLRFLFMSGRMSRDLSSSFPPYVSISTPFRRRFFDRRK